MANVYNLFAFTAFANTSATSAQAFYVSPFADTGVQASAVVATEANIHVKAYDAATLTNLVIYGNRTGTNCTCRTRNNLANGNQSISITSTSDALYEDASNSDAVTAGNPWAIQGNQSGVMSDVITLKACGLHYSVSGATPITGGGPSTGGGATSVTYFAPVSGAWTSSLSTEPPVKMNCRAAQTYDRFRLSVLTYSSTSSTSRFRKNTANGNQNCVVTATGAVEDVSNSDACSAVTPDVFDVGLTNSSTMNGMGWEQWIFRGNQAYIPQTSAASITWVSGESTTSPRYSFWGRNDVTVARSATEASAQSTARAAATWKRLLLRVDATDASVAFTARMRIAGVDGNVAITIPAATASGTMIEDTSNSDAVASGNTLSLKTSWTGTPATSCAGYTAQVEQEVASNVTTTKTQTATARVQATTTKTQTGKAAVQNTTAKTETATARIRVTTTRTEAAIARLQATATQTQSQRAAVRNTTARTEPATARLQVTTTQTESAIARLVSRVAQTLPATSRLQATTTRTEPATAAIRNTSTQTETATARLRVTTSRTEAAIARVQATASATEPATARVQNTTTKTEPGTARLQTTATQTETAIARLVNRVTQTQPAAARVQATTSRTEQGTARLQVTTSRTEAAVARLQTTALQTEPAAARLEAVVLRTQPAGARVQVTTSRTEAAIARLQVTTSRTEPATARLQVTTSRTQTALATIQSTSGTTRTQTAAADVKATTTRTQAALARLQVAGQLQTQAATARVRTTVTRTEAAIARLQSSTLRTEPATARLQVTAARTETAAARVQTTSTATQADRARLQSAAVAQQLQAMARLQRLMTQTQPAIARLRASSTWTLPSRAAVRGTTTRSRGCAASIVTLAPTSFLVFLNERFAAGLVRDEAVYTPGIRGEALTGLHLQSDAASIAGIVGETLTSGDVRNEQID